MLRKGTKDLNKTNGRLRLIVLIAVSTGNACVGDIRGFLWSDVMYSEGPVGGNGKTEGRQDALRPDVAGAGR